MWEEGASWLLLCAVFARAIREEKKAAYGTESTGGCGSYAMPGASAQSVLGSRDVAFWEQKQNSRWHRFLIMGTLSTLALFCVALGRYPRGREALLGSAAICFVLWRVETYYDYHVRDFVSDMRLRAAEGLSQPLRPPAHEKLLRSWKTI